MAAQAPTGTSVGARLEEWLLDAIATACRCDRAAIGPETCLAELAMDSLTLVSIVAQIELVHSVEISMAELNEMLQAARIADLSALLQRRLP